MNSRILSAIFASALLVSPSFAADQALLPAGKPAGVRNADLSTPALLAYGVLVAIGVGVGLIVTTADATKSSPSTASVATTTTG
jgi:hypothetical protein